MTLYITISHTSKSQAKAVDGLLELQIPYYLKVLSYGFGDGLPSSSVDKSEFSKIKFKVKQMRCYIVVLYKISPQHVQLM